jgi:Rha family phage regulatory protein
MNELTITKINGGAYINSREVAEAIGKRHNNLLRDISGYIKTMSKIGALNFERSDFFVESTYFSEQNKEMPCFLISKMGCELIANKLIGEKGVLFTCAYVSKFNTMERQERENLEALISIPTPRLGEINACSRIVVRSLKNFGASPESILNFLKNAYEPFGISVVIDMDYSNNKQPRWYKATDIARECGVYSINGKPHHQAVTCILNENLFIGADHKRLETGRTGEYTSVSVHYDEYARSEVQNWIAENGYPDTIYGFDRTYHVEYSLE